MLWNDFDNKRETLKRQYTESKKLCGLTVEELTTGVDEIYKKHADDTAIVRQAAMLEYIFANMPIAITPDDFFADYLLFPNALTFRIRDLDAIQNEHPDSFRADRESRSAGACYPGIDIGHIAPDWDRLMAIGVPGIIADLRRAKEKDPDNEYYDSCLRVYEAFRRLILRFADEADTYHTEKTDFTAKNLRAIADAAPKTLAEGMQLTFLFYRTTNIAETTIIRSLGNIDRLYAPLYRADLSGNEFSESNLRELTRDFLWKISAMKTGANLPLMIGGIDENGQDSCNEYTTVLLEEYRSLGIYDPKIHVLWHEGMKEEVFRMILAMIREGKNSFVFINTPLAAKALEKIGVSPEDAKRVAVYGCYETAAAGTELPATCGGTLNMVKAVELALNDGTDPVSKLQVGPHTGLSFYSFEDFLAL